MISNQMLGTNWDNLFSPLPPTVTFLLIWSRRCSWPRRKNVCANSTSSLSAWNTIKYHSWIVFYEYRTNNITNCRGQNCKYKNCGSKPTSSQNTHVWTSKLTTVPSKMICLLLLCKTRQFILLGTVCVMFLHRYL